MSRQAAHFLASASAVSFQILVVTCGAMAFSTAQAAPQIDPTPAQAASAPSTAAIPADATKLRICSAANQLPYSDKSQSGFENKVASTVAKAMGREPVFVFSDKPAIYLVRDWLDKKKCDVVIGLDAGDQRVLTTKPYYRASYVFVSKKDRDLAIESWNDPKIKTLHQIVVDLGSPSEVMLKEVDKYNDNMAYLYSLVGFRAPRNEYVQIAPQRMIGEVQSGGADLAAAFAPDVARFVKADPTLAMVAIKNDATHNGGEKLPQQYDQSMGVRIGDAQLVAQLDAALVKAKPAIDVILRDEGIPLEPLSN